MQAKAVCFFCLRKAWQLFAITLVTLAVLVSALKYALPYANEYRDNIEALVQKQFNIDISIGQISASWEGNGPALVLESLSFKDNQNSPIAVEIAKTSLQLNVIESLRRLQIASNYFVIEGFEADINLAQLKTSQEQQNFEQQALIEGLFLGDVGHFAIQNSRLNLTFDSGKTHSLLLKDLIWQNSIQLHQGTGEIALPGFSQGQFNARLSLSGSKLSELNGNIYVSADTVNPVEWLGEFVTLQYPDIEADINAQLWLGFSAGALQDISVDIKPSVLTWVEDDRPSSLALDDAQFILTPEQQGWRVKSSGIQFTRDQQALVPVNVEAVIQPDAKTLWFEDLNISFVAELAQLLSFPGREALYGMNPNGVVSAAKLTVANNGDISAWGVIDELAFQPYEGIPGLYGTRAEFNFVNQQAHLNLSAENVQLLARETFKDNLKITQLSGDIYLQRSLQQQWQLSSPNLWLSNQDLALSTEFTLQLGEQPELALYAELLGGRGEIADSYFPVSIMRDNLVDYLERGIISGQHLTTQVLLNGPLQHFPYANKEGQFEVKSQLNDVIFSFAPDWPNVQQGEVELHFENQRMDIYAHSGKLLNQRIQEGVVVSIADLSNADILTVDINHQTPGQTLQPFFAATPLADPLANIFSVVQVEQPARGDIQLQVDLRSGATQAQGEVWLDNNRVYLSKPGMQLTDVSGRVAFVDDTITIEQLRASWLDMPLSLQLSGSGDSTLYQLDSDIELQAEMAKLQPHTNGILDNYLAGTTTLNASLALRFADTGFSYKAKFDSDLRGVASQLPQPLHKPAEQTTLLRGTVLGDDISNLITANWGEQLYFNAIIGNDSGRMDNAHLILAEQDLGLNTQGFDVTIAQQNTELLPWLPLLKNITNAANRSEGKSFFPALNRVQGQFASLSFADIPFHDVEFTLTPAQSGTLLRLNSKEMRTQVSIPASSSSRPIHINSDYLRLNLPQEQQTELLPQSEESPLRSLDWLLTLPATEFVCSDCKVDDYQLDRVNLSLFGDGEKLNISELVIDKEEHQLNASGRFEQGQSRFNGVLISDDFGELTDEFDITSTIKDSSANIEFDLAWQGAPYDLNVASLAGELDWRLGEGHLAEISDKGARVFSLLSLDSLIRKLRLDFRDVFSKGFFYNSMSGKVRIDKGIAYSDDSKLDGVPADLSIRGYANLNNHEINYDLAVAPQVTSSLPVIMAWAVNPVTGLAALALDKVIHSARVISEINFKITGTMQEPIVTEVDRKSKEVELPQPIVPEGENPTSGEPALQPEQAQSEELQPQQVQQEKGNG